MDNAETEVRSEEIYLTKFPFTDLYIRLDMEGVPSRFRPDITRISTKTYKGGNWQVPEKYNGHMDVIRHSVNEVDQDEGTISYQGLRMRFVKMQSEEGMWASLRAVPLEVPNFEELGLHPDFTSRMMNLSTKKGLIIVGGKTGDGKTTTCMSYLKKILEEHRGLLFTMEDPPEFALDGEVADGAFCMQYQIRDNEDWSKAARIAMRSRPDYIFFGEIRTPEAAENLLKTLTSGHLVVATIHAGQVGDTISALMQLAEHKLGRVARESLADRLLCAVHQTLTADGPRIECVMPGELQNNERSQIVDLIKSGKLDNLQNQTAKFAPIRRVQKKTD